MTNPLIAEREDSTEAFTGVAIAESVVDTKEAIESGDWAAGALGIAGTALDAVGMAMDPFGAIFAAGVGWLIEHVGPVSDALDALTGDPDEIKAHADTWKNVHTELADITAELTRLVEQDTAAWTGQAGDAYRARSADTAKLLEAAHKAADGAANGITTAGEIVGAVRTLVRDIIAELVGHLISWALQVIATLGIALTWVVPQVIAEVAKVATNIAEYTTKLVDAFKKLTPLLDSLRSSFGDASKALKDIKAVDATPTPTASNSAKGPGDLRDGNNPGVDKGSPGVPAPTTSSGTGPNLSDPPSTKTDAPKANAPSEGSAPTTASNVGPSNNGGSSGTSKGPNPAEKPTEQPLNDPANTTQSSASRPKNENDTGTPTNQRNTCGDPIDVGTGEVVLTELDLELPDPFALALERTHISGYRAGRRFGSNWAATVDQRLEVDAEGVCFVTADGMILVYPHPEPGLTVEPAVGPAWPLSRRPDGTYTVEAEGRTLWFATRSGAGQEIVELDAITGAAGGRIEVDRHAEALVLTHSAGYRVALHTTQGRVTELHVLSPGNSAANSEPADVLVLRYGYDDRGMLTELVNSSGLSSWFDYDDAGRLTGWQDRTGAWYRYEYDPQGRCVRAFGTEGRLNGSFTYDAGRSTTAFTDSLGNVTHYLLNERHQTIRETDPLGGTTASEWDARHRLLARTDPLGRTTRFEYRPNGSLGVVVRPDGSRVTVEAGDGLDIEVTADDRVWRRSYVETERPDPFRDPLGVSVSAGLPITTTGPAPEVSGDSASSDQVPRDMFGRPTKAPDESGAAARVGWTIEGKLAWRAGAGAAEQWRYDPEGNEVSYRDPDGNTRSRQYGPFGLLVAETDPAGARTEHAYDTELRLITVTNPLGQTWHYAYDPVGRVTESIDFDGRRSRFDYDSAGQLIRAMDATGTAVEYRYDVLGNVVEQRTAAGVTTFAYDPVGQLVSATSPDAELTITRDELGRVTSQTVNGRTVTFDYDETSRTVRRRTPSGVDSHASYATDGAVIGLEIDGYAVDVRALAAGSSETGARYRLDANGRVNEVARPGDVERYRYDALGNLTTSPLAGLHQYEGTTLVRTGATTYRYDALGRMVHRSQLTPDGPREWHYAWGPQDRLIAVTTPEGIRWRYHYDPLGRRIAKQRLDSAGAVVEQTEFVWDGPVLIEEIRTDATGTRATTWAHDPEDNRPVVQAENASQQGIHRLFTIHTDRVGTPVELRDTGGAVAWRSHSTLWGAPRVGAPESTADTPLRFPGQYHDAETGLHYNVFRYYDPTTARYVSQDPLGLAPAANPVAYVPNPLVESDPLGLVNCSNTGSSNAPTTPGANRNPRMVTNSRSSGISKKKFNTSHTINNPALMQAANTYLGGGKKKTDSEAMGEQGALEFLRARTGQDIQGLHAPDANSPHDLPTTPGAGWSHAVKYDSSGVTDVVHWDGKNLNVVEAKGGGSGLGSREQSYFHRDVTGDGAYNYVKDHLATQPKWQQPSSMDAIEDLRKQDYRAGDRLPTVFSENNTGAAPKLHQGDSNYLTDIGHNMRKSDAGDGRDRLGQQILDHQAAGTLNYIPVHTKVLDDGSVDVQAK